MTILIFLLILSVLVFVHEMGHFLLAKWAGVRVDEFGFGYPPRAWKMFRRWNTDFTLNWIPFGGFVKIFGENYTENTDESPSQSFGAPKKFTEVSKKWQVAILAAGVSFNIIFAWILLSLGFLVGMPYSPEDELGNLVTNEKLVITSVLPGSPAETGGLKPGDVIRELDRSNQKLINPAPEQASQFIGSSAAPLELHILRGKEEINPTLTPTSGIVADKLAVGISMDTVGTLKLPLPKAVTYGAKNTWDIFSSIVVGVASLVGDLFQGKADLSQVAGPVGIVGLVGDASKLGLIYLLTFTVVISINLAVINLIPFPALDGGRILFVIIEYFKGSRINPKVFNIMNTVGFLLLITFMVFITWHDIVKLF